MQSASNVDNDDNESAESAISHQVQRLRGGADDDEDENYIEYYDYDEYHDDWHRELGPVIAQSEYQRDNVYSFKLKPGVHHDSAYNEELDDLPDPRLYYQLPWNDSSCYRCLCNSKPHIPSGGVV
jgi:hypothetical protein